MQKPLEEFHVHKLCLYGVNSTCKNCRKIHARTKRLNNIDAIRIKEKEYRDKNRNKTKEWHKNYMKNNPIAFKESQKKYRKKNIIKRSTITQPRSA